MHESRYIIGIDLGTTNSALFYADLEADAGRLQHFPVPQLVGPGERRELALLPSFCYLAAAGELPAGALALPWDDAPDFAVGSFARDHGTRAPRRLVSSAKSWLAHAGVDRTQPILPWGGELGERMLSPVAVTARYLAHLRRAWDHRFAAQRDRHGSPCLFADQQVVITIPASFDEAARELTLEAARLAGYCQPTLLEEPLAAFYAWLAGHEQDWREHLRPGEKVLVIDVGGGTTDFSFIELNAEGALHRFAVGDHLLLGGDNIDMAIARQLEDGWGAKLDAVAWAELCQLCRRAKEELLEDRRDQATITLLGRGSSVLGQLRRAELQRDRLTALIQDGFYPLLPADAPPPKARTGMRQMGLPYAADPAVTRHLLQFLRYAARVAGADGLLYPDRILFNGGSMRAEPLRARVLAAVAGWFPDRPAPRELQGEDLSLAVAIGAAYYGRVRRGQGVKVRGGIARSYFLEVEAGAAGARLLCIMARDTDENVPVAVPGSFRLRTNAKAAFRLFSSATRLHDRPGDVGGAGDDVSLAAPLVSVLRFGRGESAEIDVTVRARLTEVGTLELQLAAAATPHTWPLSFDLRPAADSAPAATPLLVLEQDQLDAAKALVAKAFRHDAELLPKLYLDLMQQLEYTRDDWPLPVLRSLADLLLELAPERRRTARHELRWLNLAGFCLRPGCGDPADELRLRQAWKLWFEGPAHARDPQVLAEWWVFWRRLAPGLKRGHHDTVANILAKTLLPKGVCRAKLKEGEQAKREMWRCLGALESLAAARKVQLGDALLDRPGQLEDYEFWVLARLGARHPFHAPADTIVPPRDAERWLQRLCTLATAGQPERLRLFAIARLGAHTGDRALDLDAAVLAAAREHLRAAHAPEPWLDAMQRQRVEDRDENARILGDSLPLGLVLADPA